MIKYIKGDLFTTKCDVIAHGCNCQGRRGSGVAKQVRAKFPLAYYRYKELCDNTTSKIDLLGTVQYVPTKTKVIANCFTQLFYGRVPGSVYVSYDAIRSCMENINSYGAPDIAFPKIGASLGGGDWDIISKIIEEELTHQHVEVWYL